MNNAVIYVRRACKDPATQKNLENQLKACREWCQKRGVEIVKEYVDDGVSGSKIENQPALMELMNDIESGRIKDIKFVVGCKYAAFSRNYEEYLKFKQFVKDHKAKLMSIQEPEADEKIIKNFIELMDEMYFEELKERKRLNKK